MGLNSQNLSKDNGLKEIVSTYTKHWKWFVFSVMVFLALAYVKLRYSVPEYAAQAKIQILDDKNSNAEFSAFQDLGMMPGGSNKVEDEIEIINSRSNLIEVVQKLGLNVKITSLGKILDSEVYKNPPFKINFIAQDSVVNNAHMGFYITLSNDTTFGYAESEDVPLKPYAYGKNISTSIGDIVITPAVEDISAYKDKKYRVDVTPVAMVAQQYQFKINVSPAAEYSNILNISLNDPIQQKANDIINTLIDTYNNNAIADRKAIADKTSEFINDRIADIYSDLSEEDQNEEEFKSNRGITDIASQSSVNLTVSASSQQELQNAALQLDIASSMKDLVENQEGYEVLPSNVGLSDPSIASTTAKYNELVAERKRLLKSSNEKNPIIVNLDQQLEGLKRSMQSSLGSMTNNLGLQVNSLSSQLSKVNSRLYAAPKNQRALRDIGRKQQTTESLYLYLLEKREESQITFASATPKSKVIDRSYSVSPMPVSPNKKIVYMAFFIFGLIVPFSVIYANDLLDNKVHSKTSLEKQITDIPVLGELPKLGKKEEKLVGKDDRSILAESLRIIRTNIDYMIKSKNNGGKGNLIYITSSVPGEGKTFLSSNLSMILASTNKKVLLIGADIRNPKLYSFFTNKNVDKLGGTTSSRNRDIGLTEYLYDSELNTKDIINSMLVHTNTIDVIYSGKIPPNPAELLMSNRMKELLEEVSEKYDYVIVDTAPLMVVTDTLLITEYADHIIYVTKAGVTEKKVLDFPVKLKNEGKLNGLSFVVNNVKVSNLGYGGSYGYGYGKSHKKWWTF
ncbi:polysaccharide biosynthesis tyrosine autokinase [Arenibacter aquaticus]|uniref:non-specific protein-tyrosine kinase n=1 Tax=Arenibacter aquaticus TaxID=2489054 RepID=A0A430K4B1_9FLAO|nr:tyrosine-protein kinase family protein [Arenibacter aquaticus]RTE53789.1 polysaccharide biosynthesis tyrosine autokinase [Arenibacter aquaticus]